MDNRFTHFLSEIQRKSRENALKAPADGQRSDFIASVRITAVLLVIASMAVYYYGLRALLVTLITTAVCCAADAVCLLLSGKKIHIRDFSAAVTGLTLSMMLPASVPYTTAAAAAIFAICIAKHPFGGHGHEIFSCAAAGWIFASLSFPEDILCCPKPFTELDLSNIVSQTLYRSSAFSASSVSDYELFIGSVAAPMGTAAVVLLAVCAMILLAWRTVSAAVLLIPAVSVFVYEAAMVGVSGAKYAVFGNMLIFGLLFLVCDFNLQVHTCAGRIIYGLICGLLIIVISEISSVENPVVYASVIAAPFIGLSDEWGKRISGILRKRKKKAALSEGGTIDG